MTVGRGQRLGLFAGTGVGKSVLLGMMTRFTEADIIVVGLIGERGREVKEFIEHSLGEEGLKRSVVVASPADDAPLMEREEYMLQSQINPQLAGHGGRVSLMEITEDGYAILQFGGGCNGCSMVDVTLKEGIEKQLLNEFPELKGVRDLTEHQRGEHSYY